MMKDKAPILAPEIMHFVIVETIDLIEEPRAPKYVQGREPLKPTTKK